MDIPLSPLMKFPRSFHGVELEQGLQTLSLRLSPLCLNVSQKSRKSLGSMLLVYTLAVLIHLFKTHISFPSLFVLYALLKLCLHGILPVASAANLKKWFKLSPFLTQFYFLTLESIEPLPNKYRCFLLQTALIVKFRSLAQGWCKGRKKIDWHS